MTGLVCCWTFTSKSSPNMERLEEDEGDDFHQQSQEEQQQQHLKIQQQMEQNQYGDQQFQPHEPFSIAGKARQLVAYVKGLPGDCCTWSDIKKRPEILLWYFGNCITYLGFYMPFLNLVRAKKHSLLHLNR